MQYIALIWFCFKTGKIKLQIFLFNFKYNFTHKWRDNLVFACAWYTQFPLVHATLKKIKNTNTGEWKKKLFVKEVLNIKVVFSLIRFVV